MTDYNNMTLREELEARFREKFGSRDDMQDYSENDYYPAGKDAWMETGGDEPADLRGIFDGEYFNIEDNGRVLGHYRSQAGLDGYQRLSATDMPNRGPIPEGEWVARYEDLETNDEPLTFFNRNKIAPWGRQRVRLRHVSGENYGRDNFYLHGSYNGLGSAGCIDTGLQMPHIARILKKYKKDLPITVKYNKKFYE